MASPIRTSLLLILMIQVCDISSTGAINDGPEESSMSEEVVPQRAATDLEQNRSRDLLPLLRAAKLSFRNHDDDHSNIDLDKLGYPSQYEILPKSLVADDVQSSSEVDAYILARLVDKMLAANRATRYGKYPSIHQEHKRNIRKLSGPREDKDYSFVANPHMNKHLVNGQWPGNRLEKKLRDMILSRGPPSR